VLSAFAILYAFVFDVSGETLAAGELALAWTWYNALVLIIVCFVCIEQPRRRKSERFETSEPIEIEADGRIAVHRLSDISITGARFRARRSQPARHLFAWRQAR